MNRGKIFAFKSKTFIFNQRFFSKNSRFNILATIQIFWGFISKFFTLSSSFYNNTVGIILSAAILYDFLFVQALVIT